MSTEVKDYKDTSHLESIASSLASQAKGNEEIEVYVSQGSEVEISVYDSEVENMTMASSTALGVRVVIDHREGRAWTESLEKDALDSALENARLNASIAEPDEFVSLVKPSDIDDAEPIEHDCFDESVIATSLEEKIALALELDKRGKKYNELVKDISSSDYDDSWGHSVLANSHGIVVKNSSTSASASITMMLGLQDSQESSGFTFARGFQDLNTETALDMAFSRGARLLNGTQPISGHVPVIFDPLVTSQFLGIIASMINGGAVSKGRALLADRLGDQIGSSILTLIDDPTNENSFSSATYDAEGMPTRRNVFIENGVLKQFTHSMYSARRLKMQPNACAKRSGVSSRPSSGVRTFYAEPTGKSVDEIFADVGEALYVQHLLGVHSGVNPLSGDFSVGAQGVWIRNGSMQDAFKEATIASDLLTMLSKVSQVANDTWWLPGSTVGNTMLIDEMVMTGK